MANISVLMAARSSDLDDQKSGVVVQTEGLNLTPLSGWNGLEETEAFGSASSHSPSQSLVRKQMPDCPETMYCLVIQVISTKMRELHYHPHMPGRYQLWNTCSEMANKA